MEIGFVLEKAITSKMTFRAICKSGFNVPLTRLRYKSMVKSGFYQTLSLIIVGFLFFAPLAAQNPKAKKQLDAAFTAFNLAEFPDALGLTKKAIKIDPTYADAYSLQA